MNLLTNISIGVIVGFLKEILIALGHTLWEAVWDMIFEGVKQAEIEWVKEGSGEIRKAWLKKKIMDFVTSKRKLGPMKKKMLDIYLDTIINRVVTALNKELGNDWAHKVESVKKLLEHRIPEFEKR